MPRKIRIGGNDYYLYKEGSQGVNWISAFKGRRTRSRSNFVAESGSGGTIKQKISAIKRYLRRRASHF